MIETATGDRIKRLVLEEAERLREQAGTFPEKPLWQAVRRTGTRLWLDTGDLGEADGLWTQEFSGLTTNNTLLNREVQKGTYDDLVRRVWDELKQALDPRGAAVEIAFVLNAVHALRLSGRFGCRVSVELHTDVAHDVEGTLHYARRYHQISPDRFIIKVPLTPAGLVATRRLGEEGVPVNFTLGFSARHNFLAAALARPGFVNVFLGRLNSFVADNGLGDGQNVGERATLSSQRQVREVNALLGLRVRQIAASMRSGEQVASLAGVDVHTMPPKVAREFEALGLGPEDIRPRVEEDPEVRLAQGIDPEETGLSDLWEVPDKFKAASLALAKRDPSGLLPETVCNHFRSRGFADLFPEWSEEDVRVAQEDGKIPRLERWKARLANGEIGLDALMNLSALMSFTTDQAAMDRRIESLIA